MLIMKVRAIKAKGEVKQLIVSIPKDSGLKEGDYVNIEKIKKEVVK